MAWLQILLSVPGEFSEPLSELCAELGAAAVSLGEPADLAAIEPVLEPAPGETIVWETVDISALWPLDHDFGHVRAKLQEYLNNNRILGEVRVNFVEDQDWIAAWEAQAEELCFAGGCLWLVPRATSATRFAELAVTSAGVLRLDPGLAFGSGQHPSTQLCLECLATMKRGNGNSLGADWSDLQVLDYGCGSGVLALAALCLGAAGAVGIDHDPQALLASSDNAAYNGLGDRLRLFEPGQLPMDEHYHLVFANILANPLKELAPLLTARLAPGGTLVLAGLLAEQAAEVMHAYPQIRFLAPARQGQWIRLEGIRAAA